MFAISSNFDKHLEKATSITNLEPDWGSIMALCDCIRRSEIAPAKALDAIKNKILSPNPNIVLLALEVLESCVKNCGSGLGIYLSDNSFMKHYLKVLHSTNDSKVRDKMLDIVSAFVRAYRHDRAFLKFVEIKRELSAEGFKFTDKKEDSEAMYSAVTAPAWAEGSCCHRCRTEFSLVNRKHHCRACGQVFCAKCSAKTSPILSMGFETPVRVCDSCYDKINKKPERKREKSSKSMSKIDSAPPGSSSSSSADKAGQKKPSDEELKAREEEELQLALALSLSENENKTRPSGGYSMNAPSVAATTTQHPKRSKSKTRSGKSKSKSTNQESLKLNTDVPDENMDPEMERYLNRDYWVNRTQQADVRFSPSPSAPAPSISSAGTLVFEPVTRKEFIPPQETNGNEAKMIGNIDATELEEFKTNLRSTLDSFITRLNQNKLRGRAISNDHGVQTMFMNLTNLHSKIIHYIQRTNDARADCERLQDKVSQIRDARAALDALRVEHREEIRRQQEEAERIKQAQMAQKLEIMRLKKQEYLQYQREMAIHRMQEQERELMMMRTVQQQPAQINAWQPAPQPQQQQYYPQPMQYPVGQPVGLPVSQTPVGIGSVVPVVSVAGTIPMPDPNMAQQQQQPQQTYQQSPQSYNQYGQPIGPVLQQYPPGGVPLQYGTDPGAVPQQYPGYNVQQQPGVYSVPPVTMQQSFVPQQQQQQQQPVPGQQAYNPQVQQMAIDQQQQQQQQPVQVNEAPLINFD